MSNFKGIIIHWTVGTGTPNAHEKESYHFLIDNKGNVIKGNHTPEDNLNCYDGNYAAHCGGGNTGRIGVSFCGMLGYNSKTHETAYPLNKEQLTKGLAFIASLCKKYNIPIASNTVMTHMEFGNLNPKTTSHGKIDISYLHPYPTLRPEQIGNFLRNEIKKSL
jgi:N-acetyl-anhydromuramyl-L-alanine amidase AmpD